MNVSMVLNELLSNDELGLLRTDNADNYEYLQFCIPKSEASSKEKLLREIAAEIKDRVNAYGECRFVCELAITETATDYDIELNYL